MTNHSLINKFNLQLFAEEEDLFFPEDDEETTEALEENPETEEVEAEETTEAEQPPVEELFKLEEMEVKFLHDVKKLKDIAPDELKTYVQKGMDYDRKLEKIAELSEPVNKIKELAGFYDMNENDLINTLFENYFEQQAEKHGLTKEIVKKEYELNKRDAKSNETKQLEKFVKAFPEVDSTNIPLEVIENWQAGKDLVDAYKEYKTNNHVSELTKEIESLKKQLKLKEQTAEVKKKSVVDSTTNKGQEDYTDEIEKLLAGF